MRWSTNHLIDKEVRRFIRGVLEADLLEVTGLLGVEDSSRTPDQNNRLNALRERYPSIDPPKFLSNGGGAYLLGEDEISQEVEKDYRLAWGAVYLALHHGDVRAKGRELLFSKDRATSSLRTIRESLEPVVTLY